MADILKVKIHTLHPSYIKFQDYDEISYMFWGEKSLATQTFKQAHIMYQMKCELGSYNAQFRNYPIKKIISFKRITPTSYEELFHYFESGCFEEILTRNNIKNLLHFFSDEKTCIEKIIAYADKKIPLKLSRKVFHRLQEIVKSHFGAGIIYEMQSHNISDRTIQIISEKLSFFWLCVLEKQDPDLFFFLNRKQKNQNDFLTKMMTINPYFLYEAHLVDSFEDVDSLYLGLNQNPNHLKRATYFLLSEIRNNHNLKQKKDSYFMIPKYSMHDFKQAFINKFNSLANTNYQEEDFDLILQKAKESQLVFHRIGSNNNYFADFRVFNAEQKIKYSIKEFLTKKHFPLSVNKEQIIKLFKKAKKKDDITQMKAVMHALQNPLFMINGGPGTGKTTIIKFILDLLMKYYSYEEKDIKLLAPTGKAAQQLYQKVKFDTTTIHSFLKIEITNHYWIYHGTSQAKKKIKLLVIDEFSMVDVRLFALLLSRVEVERIIIVGDSNQLPTIDYGELMSDFLTIPNLAKVTLKTNHRSSEGVGIIKMLEYIAADHPEQSFWDNIPSEINLRDNLDHQLIWQKMLSLVELWSKKGLNYVEDIQIISPVRKKQRSADRQYYLGVNHINHYFHEHFQANHKTMHHYKKGDKVMYLVNNNKVGIYNGDLGVITQVHNTYCEIKFSHKNLKLPWEDITNISLAYACTVHKAQGSEYQKIIFLFDNMASFMLNKNLIYTALSRAKSEIWFFGNLNYLKNGISKSLEPRNTFLKKFIQNM